MATKWKLAAAAALVVLPAGQSLSAQSAAALARVMRQKVTHSQALLAAVVTSNWADLERHSRALIDLTRDPAWTVLKTPAYATQSQEFVRAAQELADAAVKHDDKAPEAYATLTMKCVQCHRYVARTRLAMRQEREQPETAGSSKLRMQSVLALDR